jgi:hypothetical protein
MKDELTTFLEWYLESGSKILTPLNDSTHFVEGVTSSCIYRSGQFQVEFLTVTANTVIPEHVHPNVDSYEVVLKGMEFVLNSEVILPMEDEEQRSDSNLSKKHYENVRVLPESLHGGRSGPNGGCFLSVQHWLNGVKPTSVGMDWKGETMGNTHTKNVYGKTKQDTIHPDLHGTRGKESNSDSKIPRGYQYNRHLVP